LTKIRDRYALRDHHQAAQWMIDNRGTPQAFGIKAGFYVLTAAAELGFLPEVMSRAQFVLLRRHDRVAQAVSLVKGKLSGQIHSRQMPKRELIESDYDPEAIAVEVNRIAERECQFVDLMTKLGKTAPVVYYEDICDRPLDHVAEICDLMGLPIPSMFEPKVRLSILRNDLSAQWVQRFRAEHGAAT
jgi:LPS sulfotransferase NodH